jgi:hypothetical protein
MEKIRRTGLSAGLPRGRPWSLSRCRTSTAPRRRNKKTPVDSGFHSTPRPPRGVPRRHLKGTRTAAWLVPGHPPVGSAHRRPAFFRQAPAPPLFLQDAPAPLCRIPGVTADWVVVRPGSNPPCSLPIQHPGRSPAGPTPRLPPRGFLPHRSKPTSSSQANAACDSRPR